MQQYLTSHIGQRVSITREGHPEEVTVTGTVRQVDDGVVVVVDDEEREWALPLARILAVGPPDTTQAPRAGFMHE